MNQKFASLYAKGIACNQDTVKTARHIKNYLEQIFRIEVPIHIDGSRYLDLVLTNENSMAVRVTGIEQVTILADSPDRLFKGAMYVSLLTLTGQMPEADFEIKPEIEEEVMMIDIARTYYSLETLKALVDCMALFQFNYLQLHFSEHQGFRISCDKHPEIVSEEHLTKAEIRELILYGQSRHIEIIPDLDSPGHLGQILKVHPEWQMTKLDDEGNEVKDSEAFDILNPEAVAFLDSLYVEYADLFKDSHYFHIGADEFIDFDHVEQYPALASYAKEKYGADASGIEVFIEYVNYRIEFVRSLGFIPRVWHDGFYRANRTEKLHLSKNCEICYWTHWNKNMATPEIFLEKGYKLVSHNQSYLYYALKKNAPYGYPSFERVMAHWVPRLYAPDHFAPEEYDDQLVSIAISIWSDPAQVRQQQEVVEDIFFTMAAFMQKNFRIDLGTKSTYQEIWQQMNVPKP